MGLRERDEGDTWRIAFARFANAVRPTPAG
jgi:hypothetical protein